MDLVLSFIEIITGPNLHFYIPDMAMIFLCADYRTLAILVVNPMPEC